MRTANQALGTPAPHPRVTRDRWLVVTVILLLAITAASWAWLVSQQMSPPAPSMNMGAANVMSLAGATTFLIAWGVMMAAMMLPSATPMIALYGAIHRNAAQSGQPGVPTSVFALVYVGLWVVLGVPVYIASVMLAAASANRAVATLLPYALALVLAVAGIYQFSPLKRSCLRTCQSPLAFLMGHWRDGQRGTLLLALDHAGRCFGCCWGLMLVLVAAGAMSLPWVLLITLVVGAEKLLPGGMWIAHIAGVALIVLGVCVAIQPGLAVSLPGTAM